MISIIPRHWHFMTGALVAGAGGWPHEIFPCQKSWMAIKPPGLREADAGGCGHFRSRGRQWTELHVEVFEELALWHGSSLNTLRSKKKAVSCPNINPYEILTHIKRTIFLGVSQSLPTAIDPQMPAQLRPCGASTWKPRIVVRADWFRLDRFDLKIFGDNLRII